MCALESAFLRIEQENIGYLGYPDPLPFCRKIGTGQNIDKMWLVIMHTQTMNVTQYTLLI